MDPSSPIRKFKRQKLDKEGDINCPILSELPDDVLSHILSFLPTKEAVQTSILSKSWKNIWTSISKLEFIQEEEDTRRTVNFVNFVGRALLFRKLSNSKITKLLIETPADVSSHLESWLSIAVRCHVEECELNFDQMEQGLSLPLGFVNSKTLTNLSVTMSGILKLPSPICLTSLKRLELCSITFPDEHSTQQLFSGCPVLESLTLIECNWENVKSISILSPRLRLLSMIDLEPEDDMIENNPDGSVFVIHGSGLKHLYYSGQFYFDFHFVNSLFPEEVSIHSDPWGMNTNQVPNRLLRLLRNVSNVPKLILGDFSLSHLLNNAEFHHHIHAPMFTNLRRLELDEEDDEFPQDTNVVFMKILQNAPHLQYLALYKGIVRVLVGASNEVVILNPVPPCFQNHLAFIDVHITKGDHEELNVVKVLLQNALVLRRMVIHFETKLATDTRNKFFDDSLKLPRGSKDCSIYTHKVQPAMK